MAFDWSQFLELAKILKALGGRSNSDAALRSSVSRAYYAAFCSARNYVRDNLGFKPSSKPTDHEEVREILDDNNYNEIADKLEELRRWRNLCDYNDNVGNLGILAENSIQHSTDILSALPSI